MLPASGPGVASAREGARACPGPLFLPARSPKPARLFEISATAAVAPFIGEAAFDEDFSAGLPLDGPSANL
jgi:hypothetical protein